MTMPAQPDQFAADLGGRLADAGADLDHGLVQLRLDLLAEDDLPSFEDLRDVGAQLAGRGIDDLVFFFDAERQRWGFHGRSGYYRSSITNVGTVEPPPAVTFSSAAVEIRVRQPSTNDAVADERRRVQHAVDEMHLAVDENWDTAPRGSATRS